MTSLPGSTRRVAVAVFLIAPLLTGCFEGSGVPMTWSGPPFSADIVDLRQPTKPATRIYVGDQRVRMESMDPTGRTALVFDPQHNTTLLISEKDRSYIDAGMFARVIAIGFAPLMRFFRPAGTGDPCTQWNTTVDMFTAITRQHRSGPPPHFTCQSLGAESVDGRSAHKWSVTEDSHSNSGTVWIDDRLQIVSKSMDQNGEMEMRNIKEGAPPQAMFEAPADYQKLSLAAMVSALAKGKAASSNDTMPKDTAIKSGAADH